MSRVQDRLVAQLNRIKELSGLSSRALAREAGLSNSSLSRYLTGQLVPPWTAVVALCRVVGSDPRPLRAIWEEASKAGPAATTRRNDLPADLADFTGREAESAAAMELVRTARAAVIDGMAGAGKTSLAIHVAHQLAPSFPDGGLYLDLHGFTPGQEPLEASAALGRLLMALGIAHVPSGTAERAALWRSELSRRQALVVLDNVNSADQVRTLLPGAGKSAVLITSRNRLVDLGEVPPVSLEPLPDEDAASLFGRASGADLADTEAVTQVLRQCGGLPLALRMAGARLRHRPGWTVAVLAERLEGHAGRFDAAFGMSLKQLDPAQRQVFRLLGVLPGTDFDAAVVSVLTGKAPERVSVTLEDLVDVHLVQEPSPGRYKLHDLIRRYAADLATEEEPEAESAVRRVLNHYAAQAIAHHKMLPYLQRMEVYPGDPATAMTWFDTEHANLIACVGTAIELGADHVVADVPQAMQAWFFRRRGSDDQVRLLEAAVAAAGRLGNTKQRAALLVDLGYALVTAGRLAEALATYELAELSDVDDEDLTGLLLLRIGALHSRLGDFEAAEHRYRIARKLLNDIGHTVGEAQAFALEAELALRLGRESEAAELARAALNLAKGPSRITGLFALGVALASTDPATSLATLHEALRLAEQDDNPLNKAWGLSQLGVALRVMGKRDEAVEQHRQAFVLLESLAEPQWEIDFLPAYALTLRVAGHHDLAKAMYERTLELAHRLGRPYEEKLAREALTA